eukprot:TRINITY_DN13447_c0_g1_i10.p1 TRINITY_DN13447_c0_g1~~TRINITY_DN13447_c0_g1_i10.p1  ORF type:complete len:593 (-),score=172.80 TRINITY_DN13447_c0_g1_i10:1077-2855(-)
MTTMSVTRVRDSPFKESEWDRRLDDMLEDLGGTGTVQTTNQGSNMSSMTQQSSSSSSQQVSYSSSSQQQVKMQSSSSSRQQAMVTNNGRTAANNFSMAKSASAVSLKDSADGVLKDLENGLKQSTNYIQESHKQFTGPDGSQEWHEVKRGADPNVFDLEQQVQHMIPSAMQDRRTNMSSAQQNTNSQNTSNQFTTYKVQSNQYSGGGERITSPVMDDDDRPASRLKQNIDELDTLLYDLNNARNLSPDGGADYGASSIGQSVGLDSDDYDETAGSQGHVKRTVNAFNEYTQQMSTSKPPSPSPRRKTQPSPLTVRKTPPSPQPQRTNQSMMNQTSSSSSQSYRYQSSSNNVEDRISPTPAFPPASSPGPSFQPQQGLPGSNQPFSYTATESPPPSYSPDLGPPSYYTKYNSSKTTSRSQTDSTPPAVAFPSQTARSPTPQMPPKRIDDLMSEFHEFDSVHSGGSPTPPMFSKPKPNNSTVVVTELPDEPPQHVRLDPVPHIHEPSPPKAAPSGPKGPDVYYPPGSEFTKAAPAPVPHPTGDGGSMSLETKGRGKDRDKGKYHDRGADSGDKQGAAVIPICLPLCCAAPCVIM